MKDFIFYGQFDPPVDKIIYETYFKNKQELGFFVECGAGNGLGNSSCYFFERFLNWKGINIEASKYAYSLLIKNRPNSFANLHCGLGDKIEIKLFKDVISAPGGGNDNGSFQHTPIHAKELEGYGCKFEEYPVQVYTWDYLMDYYGFVPDLFVLDVEGYELQVFNGMNKFLPKVICVEFSYSGLSNIMDVLVKKGYTMSKFVYNNAYFYHESFNSG